MSFWRNNVKKTSFWHYTDAIITSCIQSESFDGICILPRPSGAWIVTGGMHAGVMKHVGQAVQDYMTAHGQKASLNVIGITPWGCVNNKESLVDPDVSCLISHKAKTLEFTSIRRR